MALPVITAANYNYGAYANPQPIKINTGPGIGEGILKAATAISSQISTANKQEREAEQKANELMRKQSAEALAKQAENQKKVSDNAFSWAAPVGRQTSQNNIGTVNEITNAKRDLELSYQNGSINFEEYAKQNLSLESIKEEMLTFGKMSKETDNFPSGFNLFEAKSTQDLSNLSLMESMKNSAVGLKFDKDKNQMVASWSVFDPTKIDLEEAAKFSGGNPAILLDYYKKSNAIQEVSVPVSEIINNPKKYFTVQTKFNFADTNENLMKIANEFDSNQGKAYMTDAVNGYMRLDKGSAAGALKGDIQVEAFYNAHGKDIAEDMLKEPFNPNDPEQVDRIKTEIANQVLLRARQVGDKIYTSSDAVTGQESVNAANEKGRLIFEQASALKPGNYLPFTYKFPNFPNSLNSKITKSKDGYVIEIEGQSPRPATEEELATIFGQSEIYNERKKEESARISREEARALIENTLGAKPKSPFLGNFGGK